MKLGVALEVEKARVGATKRQEKREKRRGSGSKARKREV